MIEAKVSGNGKREYQCSCPLCTDERKAEDLKKADCSNNVWCEDDYLITA